MNLGASPTVMRNHPLNAILRFDRQLVGLLFLLITLWFPVSLVFAQADRARIGLVLSGGGARGATHIGVIRELERQRIPVDYISGTSMGAIIGGLYASGLSPDELEQTMASMDWKQVLSDSTNRQRISHRRKQDDILFFADKEIGVRNGALKLPSGVLKGQNLYLKLKELTLHVSTVDDFDRFDIPFRCVATDISNGSAVVFGSGDLARAMRASMAVPAIFSPVQINGRLLVDGGISNNLPIDVVRDMGADIVIAVDIATPLIPEQELDSVVTIASQLSNLLTRGNVQKQIASLGEADLLITPELGDFSSADFVNSLDTVPEGNRATRQLASKLAPLALSRKAYTEHLAARSRVAERQMLVNFIRIENNSNIKDELIVSRLGVEIGQPVDTDALENGIADIYGLDIFESITYTVAREHGKTGLVVNAREKPWGPDYLQLGLRFSTNLGNRSGLTLGLGHIRVPLNDSNGEWRSFVRFGEKTGLLTEIYQPWTNGSPYFVHGWLSALDDFYDVVEQGEPLAVNRMRKVGFGIATGRELSSWGDIRIGYERFGGNVETVVGVPIDQSDHLDGGEVFAHFSFDTLDDSGFPRDGVFGTTGVVLSRIGLGGDQDFDQLFLDFLSSHTTGRNTVHWGADLFTTWNGSAPITNQTRVGGLFNLPGFTHDALVGQNLVLLKSGYMRSLGTIFSMDAFAGLNVQLGNVFDDKDDIDTSDFLWSTGLWVGLDSVLGPLYLGYGVAEQSRRSLYLILGAQF